VPDPTPPPTIPGALDAYSRECAALGKSEPHLRSIATARAYLVRWRGEAADADLRRSDLVDFVGWAKRATGSKGRAIHNALVILRTALKIAELPVPPMPPPELPAREPKTLKADELGRLLRELPVGTVARTALEIGLHTGIREAEIRRLQVGDVDLRHSVLLIRRCKGRKSRRREIVEKPISHGLAKSLRLYMRTLPPLEPEAPLLAVESYRQAHPDGRREKARHPLSLSSLRRALEAACERAGVPKKSTVGWTRAENATLLRENGETLGNVSKNLGHAGTAVTLNHYDESGRDESERWEAAKRIAVRTDRVLSFVGKRGATLGPVVTTNAPTSSRAASGK
jgi:integrase